MQSGKILAKLAVSSLFLLMAGISPAAAVMYGAGNDYNLYGHLYQGDVPEIGSMACCPTAAINSFTYLQNQFPSVYGSRLASTPPTIADVQTIAGPNYMSTEPAVGTSDPLVIWGRYLYIESRLPLQTHYSCQVSTLDGQPLHGDQIENTWTVNRPLPAYLDNAPGSVAVPTWQFIYQNLKKGADLGVSITFLENGSPTNIGHCLTLRRFSFDDKNNNGLIDRGEGSISFVDPAGTTEVTCNVSQNSNPTYLSGYPYLLFDIYNKPALIDSLIAQYPAPQPIPNTVAANEILVLSTNAPYGTLTFHGGVLYAADPQTTWNKALILGNEGSIMDSATNSCTLTGTISGAGALTKMGSGTLFLRGNNSFSGGTMLLEGAVNIVRDENLGGPSGSLIFQGGTLQAGAALTLSRPVVFRPVTGQFSTLNTFDTGVYASIFKGSFSGEQVFRQIGQGSLTVAGDASDLIAAYKLDSGTLIIANTFGSDPSGFNRIEVGPSGILKGAGTLQAKVINEGTVNPGNSVGTMKIVGPFVQVDKGRLEVEVASATSFDKLSISGRWGVADLGGTLKPILLAGYRPPANTVFPGIVTAGLISSSSRTFDTIENNTPILTWQALYSDTQVDLTLNRDYAKPSLGLNRNQHAVGTMFNGVADTTSGDLARVLNTLDNLPTGSAVAAAYQQISSDKVSALPALSLAGSMMQWQNVANRLNYQRWCRGGLPNLGAGRSGSFNLSYNSLAGLMLAYNGSDLTGLVSAPRPSADGARTWGLFTDFVSTFGSQDSTANVTGYNFTILGFTAGADYRLRDDLVIGLGTGYYHTSAAY
jgi:autotransporter-associated beta strand protein